MKRLALLIAMLQTGCGGGKPALPPTRAQAVAEVARLAGSVNEDGPFGYTVDMSNTRINDEELAELARLFQAVPELRAFYLADTPVTDAGLASLKALPQLRTLVVPRHRLNGPSVRDLQSANPKLTVVGPPQKPVEEVIPVPKE